MPIRIEYLDDFPDHITTIATWFHGFWGNFYPERTIEDWKKALYLNKGTIPFSLVAFKETTIGLTPIGTASIKKGGMGDYESDSLWLAGVFVIESERGKGVASALIKKCIAESKMLKANKIMLFTRTNGRLYEKLGWNMEVEKVHQDTSVKVMSNTLELAYTTETDFAHPWKDTVMFSKENASTVLKPN